MDAGIPDDAVEVGRIQGAWGVKGWIKVQPFSQDPQALFSSKRWFLKPPEGPVARPSAATAHHWPELLRVAQAREQGDGIVAAIHDLNDRDAAEALKGGRIFVSRSSFPTADEGEFYWVDLIGCDAFDADGALLGQVVRVDDHGAHAILEVLSDSGARHLIPFVAAYVVDVDLARRCIRTEWRREYSQ